MALPEASTKLRIVLDYLPCEACLAQPTEDQELLCTLCARLHRQVAVRASTRTSVIVERPSPPEAPVVIPPADVPRELETPPPAPAPPPARPIAVRFADEPAPEGDAVDVVVEPLAAPSPAPVVAAVPLAAEEPEPEFDDLVSFSGARDEFFDYRKAPEPEPAPAAAPSPEPAPAAQEDDFVFRPPPEEPARAAPAEAEEQPVPTEEVRVEREDEDDLWAPPSDFLAEETQELRPEPERAPEPEPIEMEVVEDEPVETEVIETEVEAEVIETEIDAEVIDTEVIDAEPLAEPQEEVLDMEVVEEEAPAPARDSDLYRLRGFDVAAEGALAKAGITRLAHLAGHDAGELATRAGLPFDRVLAWTQVADLVQEVGVPVDAAVALVHAGIAGPRGLQTADADEIVDRVNAFGSGYQVSASEVKRWKRRA